MTEALIVAYGNPLRCDDGLAWRAAEQLSKLNLPNVEIVCTHQLTPEIAHSISLAAFAVFLDARHGATPGELIVEPITPVAQSPIFTHGFSPGGILNAAAYLYGKAPDAVLISLVGEDFGHGEQLSEKVAAALPGLVGHVRELLVQRSATLQSRS